MRRFRFVLMFLLLLATLSCGLPPSATEVAPTPTPVIVSVATNTPLPPPTVAPPVTDLSSPTAAPPPTVVPTATQPPAATPTTPPQQPAVPTITSFTADRTTIVEREDVTLSWQASGGTEAFISWVGHNGLLDSAPGPINPDGGTVTINPDGDGDIVLLVRNSAGEAEAHIQLTIECLYGWVPALAGNPPSSHCPGRSESGPAAQQSFENGFMIWMGSNSTIYVFYNQPAPGRSDPAYHVYNDEFSEGDPESDPAIVPPTGLYQPIRGFGLVWRTYPEVRDGLGWATAPEAGFETWKQEYSLSGMHSSFTVLQGIDGTMYHLSHFDSSWQVYSP